MKLKNNSKLGEISQRLKWMEHVLPPHLKQAHPEVHLQGVQE